MSYRLRNRESLSEGVRRIAFEEIDKALNNLAAVDRGLDEAVHDTRKRFKKIRAVARLVRDELGPDLYRLENHTYRDAARRLSVPRDSAGRVETLDKLAERFSDRDPAPDFSVCRRFLEKEHEEAARRLLEGPPVFAEIHETVREARGRIVDWPLSRDGAAFLAKGLRRVYRRGRNALAEAYAHPAPETFHEWRKRVKYLWYHLRILRPLWPEMLKPLADETHRLADFLGDAHDLDVLRRYFQDHPRALDGSDRTELFSLLDERLAELRAAARPLGERIYVEKPKRFVRRMRDYRNAWRSEASTDSG